MERIYPVNKKKITSLMDQYICAVLYNGSYYIGKLNGMDDGYLILTESKQGLGEVSVTDEKKAEEQINDQIKAFAFFPFAHLTLLPQVALVFIFILGS